MACQKGNLRAGLLDLPEARGEDETDREHLKWRGEADGSHRAGSGVAAEASHARRAFLRPCAQGGRRDLSGDQTIAVAGDYRTSCRAERQAGPGTGQPRLRARERQTDAPGCVL